MSFFCFTAANAQLKVGETLGSGVNVSDETSYLLTSSGGIDKVFTVAYRGCTYKVKLNPDKTVKMIFTTDENFETTDDIRIGSKWLTVKKYLADTIMYSQPGWAKYYLLKSGWKAAFDFRYAITDSSKVSFLFR
jgi:hypothetical protein